MARIETRTERTDMTGTSEDTQPSGTTPGGIVEFLLERIAEDETVAREASFPYVEGNWRTYENDVGTIAMTKDRALAECQAKRGIIEALDAWDQQWIARVLAAVYADHPDYQPAWRP